MTWRRCSLPLISDDGEVAAAAGEGGGFGEGAGGEFVEVGEAGGADGVGEVGEVGFGDLGGIEFAGEADDLPAVRDRQVGGVLQAEIVGAGLGLQRQRADHRRRIRIAHFQRRHGRGRASRLRATSQNHIRMLTNTACHGHHPTPVSCELRLAGE